MAVALTADQKSKIIHFNGCRYATLDFTSPGTLSSGNQSSVHTFPSGWQIAPDVPEIVEEIVRTHPWGTMLLLLDGAAYSTSLSESPGRLMKRVYATRDGDRAKPSDPSSPANQRILMTDSWISSIDQSSSIGKHLFTSQCFADCTIECGGETIKCHRAVLSLSPVFQRMLESDMCEGLDNRIRISDAEPHIVKMLVQFIYIGSAPIKIEELAPLMVLADKYELEDLSLLTATRLIEQMSEDTVVEVVKHIRPFMERQTFEPVVSKLRKALIESKGMLDMIIKRG